MYNLYQPAMVPRLRTKPKNGLTSVMRSYLSGRQLNLFRNYTKVYSRLSNQNLIYCDFPKATEDQLGFHG